ncbi:MAG TPA: hypothetical protein VJ890_23230 [Vineibacter sp.]|nr:hypothetical protein [Vineibacter sp.]
MLSKIFSARRRTSVETAATLAVFLSEKASLVTQKAVIGYCYVRTSLPLHELMRDQPFAEAFERGRWLAYTAVLEDMFVIAEGRLRPSAADDSPRLAAALARCFDGALADTAGAAVRDEARSAATEVLHRRLSDAQALTPRSIADITQVSGQRVYEAMPIHERHRRLDRESIIAGVRFVTVGLAGEFARRIDAPRVVADLLTSPTNGPPTTGS